MDAELFWDAWVTLALILLMLVAIVTEVAPPYLVMVGSSMIFLFIGLLDIEDALHGFSDEAVLCIAILFIVAKGVQLSGGPEYLSKVIFQTKAREITPDQPFHKAEISVVWILLKFTLPVVVFSAFLANVDLMALLVPSVVEFSHRVNMAPSKFLLPVSFASLLGATLTLIGTSTNILVASLAAKKIPDLQMHLFDIGIVGVPVTLASIVYIVVTSSKLLPNRLAIQPTSINARKYHITLVVKSLSSLNSKTVEQSGLQRMAGLKLVQIERGEGNIITNINEDFVILSKDRLYFVGVIDEILALTRLDGLALSEDEGDDQVDLNKLKKDQYLVEAVIASNSSMVHKRIADLQFWSRYRVVVVAVHRHGAVSNRAIGDIVLEAGDCLLVVADGSDFVSKHRNNSSFALVSQLPGFIPIQRQKAGVAAAFVLLLVFASGLGIELITAAFFAAAGLILTNCLSPKDSIDSIQLPVILMAAATFGISEAMLKSTAADLVARVLLFIAGNSKFGLITWTYVATTIFSLVVTNYAAVSIMFPVALSAAQAMSLDFRPFAYTLMLAASAGFMSPSGCQSNLMVYGPGGYRFMDYVKYGGPLQIVLFLVTIGVSATLKWWWLWWAILIVITISAMPLATKLSWNTLKDSSSENSDDFHDENIYLNDADISSSTFVMAS